ncbi:MAG: hypothetical protein MHM6MM_007627 [Cercozoa sp. M6MM]
MQLRSWYLVLASLLALARADYEECLATLDFSVSGAMPEYDSCVNRCKCIPSISSCDLVLGEGSNSTSVNAGSHSIISESCDCRVGLSAVKRATWHRNNDMAIHGIAISYKGDFKRSWNLPFAYNKKYCSKDDLKKFIEDQYKPSLTPLLTVDLTKPSNASVVDETLETSIDSVKLSQPGQTRASLWTGFVSTFALMLVVGAIVRASPLLAK